MRINFKVTTIISQQILQNLQNSALSVYCVAGCDSSTCWSSALIVAFAMKKHMAMKGMVRSHEMSGESPETPSLVSVDSRASDFLFGGIKFRMRKKQHLRPWLYTDGANELATVFRTKFLTQKHKQ